MIPECSDCIAHCVCGISTKREGAECTKFNSLVPNKKESGYKFDSKIYSGVKTFVLPDGSEYDSSTGKQIKPRTPAPTYSWAGKP